MTDTPRESSSGHRWVDEGTLNGDVAAALVASLADAVVVADREGIIVAWNDAAAVLFGWPAGDALGQSLDLIIPERWRERHWAGYQRVMETGTSSYGTELLQTPASRRNGEPLSIAFTVTVVRDGDRIVGIAAVVRDETERRDEMRRLRGALDARDR